MQAFVNQTAVDTINYAHLRFAKDRIEKRRESGWILAIRRETTHWVVVKDVSASEYPIKEVLYGVGACLAAIAIIWSAWPDVSLTRWLAAAASALVSFLLFRNQRNALTVLEASTENGVGRIDFRDRLSADEIEQLNARLADNLGWPVKFDRSV